MKRVDHAEQLAIEMYGYWMESTAPKRTWEDATPRHREYWRSFALAMLPILPRR